MKGFIGLLLLLTAKFSVAQYYYKDIVLTNHAIQKWKAYKDNKVKSVVLSSVEGNGQPTEGFECTQDVASNFSTITTFTKATIIAHSSSLVAYYDVSNGLLKKTVDTSDTYQSTSDYSYDASGRLTDISNTSIETDNNVKSTEQHIWNYDAQGKPAGMLKIKNGNDTTFISFVKDEKGNITEEHSVRHKINLPTIYYYYNNDNLLTDVVRYNEKAQRLLPDYMFEYNSDKRVSSMLFVPAGSSDYQRWVYEYDANGLRTTDRCFNKKKELMGMIKYEYK